VKTNLVIVYTIILLLLQSILGHTDLYAINLFAIVAGVVFILSDSLKFYFIWLLVFSIISDLILVQWLGTYLFANVAGVACLTLINKFFEVLNTPRNYISMGLYLVLTQSIIYSLSIITGREGEIKLLLVSTLYSLIIGIPFLAFSKKFIKKEVIVI